MSFLFKLSLVLVGVYLDSKLDKSFKLIWFSHDYNIVFYTILQTLVKLGSLTSIVLVKLTSILLKFHYIAYD